MVFLYLPPHIIVLSCSFWCRATRNQPTKQPNTHRPKFSTGAFLRCRPHQVRTLIKNDMWATLSFRRLFTSGRSYRHSRPKRRSMILHILYITLRQQCARGADTPEISATRALRDLSYGLHLDRGQGNRDGDTEREKREAPCRHEIDDASSL